MTALLEIKGLTKYFGGLAAVNQLDMTVNEGDMFGLMGPNGAGKTTVFNLITGFFKPWSGQVVFRGRQIGGMKPHVVAGYGIGRTFQFAYLFPDFTVLENVIASFHLDPKCGVLEGFLNTRSYRRKEARIAKEAEEILRLVGLEGEGRTGQEPASWAAEAPHHGEGARREAEAPSPGRADRRYALR